MPFLTEGTFKASGPVIIVPKAFFVKTIFYVVYSLVTQVTLTPMRLGVDAIASVLNTPVIVCVVVPGKKEGWSNELLFSGREPINELW